MPSPYSSSECVLQACMCIKQQMAIVTHEAVKQSSWNRTFNTHAGLCQSLTAFHHEWSMLACLKNKNP